MPGPLIRKQTSPLNQAVKEKLPGPLQGLMESDPVSDLAPTPVAAGAALRIPLQVVNDYLRSSRVGELASKFGPTLKEMYRFKNWSGSSDVASIASGIRRNPHYSYDRMPGLEDPAGRIPGKYWRNMEADYPITAKAAKEASEQLYEATQTALGDLGAAPGREIELWRAGNIDPRPYLLTPTHIDEATANSFSYPSRGYNRFDVPREAVQAMVGLLRQGDAITRGEMLVPSHAVQRGFKEAVNGPGMVMQEALGVAPARVERIPSWFKEQMKRR